jgi:hypothetical protein
MAGRCALKIQKNAAPKFGRAARDIICNLSLYIYFGSATRPGLPAPPDYYVQLTEFNYFWNFQRALDILRK